MYKKKRKKKEMNFYESRYKNKSNDVSNSTGRETNSLRKIDGNITDSCNRGRRKYLHTYLHKDTYTYRRGDEKGRVRRYIYGQTRVFLS